MSINQTRYAVGLAISLCAGSVLAQDQTPTETAVPEPVKTAKPSRDELKDKQLDVSLEARDIERVLGKLKKASELAKTRITEAATTTESVTTSLNKGDAKTARAEAKQASEKFKEIAKQLEALLKEETPQQITEAKQLAAQLAKLEREFAEKFEGALNPTQASSGAKTKLDPKSQVKPMVDPDLKGEGSGSPAETKNAGQGKSGTVPKPGKKPSPDGKHGDEKADSKTGDKPMPDGQGGDKTEDEKKPGNGGKPDDMKNGDDKQSDAGAGKKSDDKKPGGGAGQDQDEAKPGDEKKPGGGTGKDKAEAKDGVEKPKGAGSSKKKADNGKPEVGEGGSGGDVPKDKSRKGTGRGSDDEKKSDGERNGGAGMTAEQLREEVARRAEKLAETGKTLQDVLNTIARSENPADKDAVAKIQVVLKEFDIAKLVEQMNGVTEMIRDRKDGDAKLSSFDLAERFEIMAGRLDAAYRGIVAPQAEELRKLEAALVELREKLETPAQVAAWHREVRELLDQLDKLGVSVEVRDLLEKEMKQAGFGLDRDPISRTLNWGLVNNNYVAPSGYNLALVHLQEDVQARIQALVLGDYGNVSDDATPPKCQEFVERHYQLLSGERGDKPKVPGPKSPESSQPK